MIERIIWAAVLFFSLLDLYLLAERVEQAATKYYVCWRCQRIHPRDGRAVEANPRAISRPRPGPGGGRCSPLASAAPEPSVGAAAQGSAAPTGQRGTP